MRSYPDYDSNSERVRAMGTQGATSRTSRLDERTTLLDAVKSGRADCSFPREMVSDQGGDNVTEKHAGVISETGHDSLARKRDEKIVLPFLDIEAILKVGQR